MTTDGLPGPAKALSPVLATTGIDEHATLVVDNQLGTTKGRAPEQIRSRPSSGPHEETPYEKIGDRDDARRAGHPPRFPESRRRRRCVGPHAPLYVRNALLLFGGTELTGMGGLSRSPAKVFPAFEKATGIRVNFTRAAGPGLDVRAGEATCRPSPSMWSSRRSIASPAGRATVFSRAGTPASCPWTATFQVIADGAPASAPRSTASG